MAIKRVFLLLATSFEINILHHWCTIPCVIKTQRYGYIRDSGGSVETPYGKITGCEKSQNGYKEGVPLLATSFEINILSITVLPPRVCKKAKFSVVYFILLPVQCSLFYF